MHVYISIYLFMNHESENLAKFTLGSPLVCI